MTDGSDMGQTGSNDRHDDLDAILFDGLEADSLNETPIATLSGSPAVAVANSPARWNDTATSPKHDAAATATAVEDMGSDDCPIASIGTEQEHSAKDQTHVQGILAPSTNLIEEDREEREELEETEEFFLPSPTHFQPVKFEIPLYALSAEQREQYEVVQSDVVDFLIEEIIESPNQRLFRLEYTDGLQDTVSLLLH